MNDFFAFLYELITSQNTDLSKLLYDEQIYLYVGLFMVILSAIGPVVYYYLLNHPRYARWFHWLFMVGVISLSNFAIAYFKADGIVWDTFENTDGYTTQIVIFAFANVFWTLVFTFAFSMIIKWKSSNAKHSPF
jgi:hypothetical protein